MGEDTRTATAFANSWNQLPAGSVYTWDQVEDWVAPLVSENITGREVLELGCGNGSLMLHLLEWHPARLVGVDLGDSVKSAKANLSATPHTNWQILQEDLTSFESDGFDVVYCIGVLHHLQFPRKGLDAVIRNVKRGGRFHCWVYAAEGNELIRYVVDPIRRLACRLPWWVTKHLVATPLVVPFYGYAKFLSHFAVTGSSLPLHQYGRWIGKREFAFFRHVAFDQLVSPRTTYIERGTLARWLASYREVDPDSIYIIMRNGNSWKFGGRVR